MAHSIIASNMNPYNLLNYSYSIMSFFPSNLHLITKGYNSLSSGIPPKAI